MQYLPVSSPHQQCQPTADYQEDLGHAIWTQKAGGTVTSVGESVECAEKTIPLLMSSCDLLKAAESHGNNLTLPVSMVNLQPPSLKVRPNISGLGFQAHLGKQASHGPYEKGHW